MQVKWGRFGLLSGRLAAVAASCLAIQLCGVGETLVAAGKRGCCYIQVAPGCVGWTRTAADVMPAGESMLGEFGAQGAGRRYRLEIHLKCRQEGAT